MILTEEQILEMGSALEHSGMSDEDIDAYLEHYGVKGMKWGVRKDRDGVSRRTNREARKDAKEYARAKMFYGDGAGTRRKLINNTVAAKKKKDPSYAKAFDRHVERQDMSTHASKARKQRKRTDRTDRTKKQASFVARNITGEMGTQAAFTAVALGGAAYLSNPKNRAKVATTYNKVSNSAKQKAGAEFLKWKLRNMT